MEATMTDTQSVKDALAFLRDLAQDGGKGLARDGFALAVIGLTFGAVSLIYWLIFSGPLAGARLPAHWLWVGALMGDIVLVQAAKRRLPPASGAAARALSTAWNGVGDSLT